MLRSRSPRTNRRRPVLAAAALAATLTAAGGAVATAQSGGDRATFAFTAKGAGQATGFTVKATLRPRELGRVQVRFPAGTRVDPTVAGQCRLSQGGPLDANLTAGDPLASCPASSKIITGSVRIVDSAGGVIALANGLHDVTIFARPGNKLYVVVSRGGDSEYSTSSSISSTGFVLAAIPGAAKSIDRLTLTGRLVTKSGRTLFRTPRRCPSTKKLTAGVVVTDAEDGPTTAARAVTACRPAPRGR